MPGGFDPDPWSWAQKLRILAEKSKPILGVTFIAVGMMLYFQFHQVSKAWALDVMPICLQDLLVVLYKSGEPYESYKFFANLFSITVLPVMASAADFVDCKPGVGGRQSCLC